MSRELILSQYLESCLRHELNRFKSPRHCLSHELIQNRWEYRRSLNEHGMHAHAYCTEKTYPDRNSRNFAPPLRYGTGESVPRLDQWVRTPCSCWPNAQGIWLIYQTSPCFFPRNDLMPMDFYRLRCSHQMISDSHGRWLMIWSFRTWPWPRSYCFAHIPGAGNKLDVIAAWSIDESSRLASLRAQIADDHWRTQDVDETLIKERTVFVLWELGCVPRNLSANGNGRRNVIIVMVDERCDHRLRSLSFTEICCGYSPQLVMKETRDHIWRALRIVKTGSWVDLAECHV